jgi:hypothetical protein
VAAGFGFIPLSETEFVGEPMDCNEGSLVIVIISLGLRVTMKELAPAYWEAFEDRIVTSLTTKVLQSEDFWTFGSRLNEGLAAIDVSRSPDSRSRLGAEYRDILPFEYAQSEVRRTRTMPSITCTIPTFILMYGLPGRQQFGS